MPAAVDPSPMSGGRVIHRRGWRRIGRILVASAAPLLAAMWIVRERTTLESGLDVLATAHPGWLTAAAGAALFTWIAGAASQQGAVTSRLPVGPLLAAQVAGSVANHVLPAGLGVGAVKLRFLHRRGIPLGEATASIGLDAAAGAVTHLVVLSVLVVGGFLPTGLPRLGSEIPIIAAAVAMALLLGWSLPPVRRVFDRARDRLAAWSRTMARVARMPSRAALLWGGSAAIPLLHAATLWSVVRALDLPLGAGAVFALYFAASAVSALVPSPGGFGSLDAVLIAALVAAGQSTATAVAVVLGYRLITVWLPMVPSACVLAGLVRHGTL
jgi:uncharacterized membrane protein YbhN (UPF0104 family)